MSRILEQEAGMDDMAAHAQRFAPIVSSIPDPRKPARHVHAFLAVRSFSTMQDALDDASEAGNWNKLADLEYDMRVMRDDAKAALRNEFKEAVAIGGLIPWNVGKQLSTISVRDWLTEWADTKDASQAVVDMLLSPAARERVITTLAHEYANDNCDDLLKAGWEA